MFKVGDEVYVVVSGVAMRAARIIELDAHGNDRYYTDWGYWYSGKELMLQDIYDSCLYKVMRED